MSRALSDVELHEIRRYLKVRSSLWHRRPIEGFSKRYPRIMALMDKWGPYDVAMMLSDHIEALTAERDLLRELADADDRDPCLLCKPGLRGTCESLGRCDTRDGWSKRRGIRKRTRSTSS